MLAKMILSGKLSGSCPVSNMNAWSFCSIWTDLSPKHTCHSMSIDFPALSFLFLQLSHFMTDAAFFSYNLEALI